MLISSSRKPGSYINICKVRNTKINSCGQLVVEELIIVIDCMQKYLQENGEVQLSALGVAISSLVTVAEILKSRELAVEKKIMTTMESRDDGEESR